MRTQKEIDQQKVGLKKQRESLPEISGLGNNNWKAIDAQLDILDGIKDHSDFEECEDDVESAAYDAEQWLDGFQDEDLYEL